MIIAECVKAEQELLKTFKIWNSKLVPFYLIQYRINENNNKYIFRFFRFNTPKNCFGTYLTDQGESNHSIFETFNKYYDHSYTFIPKGITNNQLIKFYNFNFRYNLQKILKKHEK